MNEHSSPAGMNPAPSTSVPGAGTNPGPFISILRAYLGSVERHGAWPVPRHLAVRVVMGSCELDLRNATLQPGVTTIDVGVVMGSVEIIVPKDMPVEIGMMAALGSVDDPTGFAPADSQHALRVIGDATLASCEIVRAA